VKIDYRVKSSGTLIVKWTSYTSGCERRKKVKVKDGGSEPYLPDHTQVRGQTMGLTVRLSPVTCNLQRTLRKQPKVPRVTRAARDATSAPLSLFTLLVGSDLTSGCLGSTRASTQPTPHGWLMLAVGSVHRRPLGISDRPSSERCPGSRSSFEKKTSCEDGVDHRREPCHLHGWPA
jgi:hypothetical protein